MMERRNASISDDYITTSSSSSSEENDYIRPCETVENVNYKDAENEEEEEYLKYVLYFDGCSKGNPGRAGCGAVLYVINLKLKEMDIENYKEIWFGKEFVGEIHTNNYAEYCGLLMGLKEARRRNIKNLIVKGDSMLVIKQMTGTYKVSSPSLLQLYNECKKIEKYFNKIEYHHIYRFENYRADKLANTTIY